MPCRGLLTLSLNVMLLKTTQTKAALKKDHLMTLRPL